MTAKNRADIKSVFENGDKPQGGDFADLVDSYASLSDTTAQTMSSNLVAPEFIGGVSAANVSISGTLTYTGETTVAAVASGAVTVPASALGYLLVSVSGRTVALPYYAV